MIADAMLWPYLAASLVCIAAPGPDSLSVLSIGVARGRREAMQFALGVGTGCLTHTLWAALGVAAAVAASSTLFGALKLAGAAYLLWLGIGALRSPGSIADGPGKRPGNTPASGRRRFVQGLVNNSLNPKVMLFFIAFLPQFVDPAAGPVSAQMLALGAGFAAMTACAYVTLGFASGRVGELLLRRPALGRHLDRLVGVLFIGLAARLALASRA